MWKCALTLLALALASKHSSAEKRIIICKTPALAHSCFSLHGRLRYGNGTPALRLWQIGTTHNFGILSGLNAEKLNPLDNDHPRLPENIDRLYIDQNPFQVTIYADFEVCPLEPHIPGHMQAACIESATHITVKN